MVLATSAPLQVAPLRSSIATPGIGVSVPALNTPLGTGLLSWKTRPEMKPCVLTASVAFARHWQLSGELRLTRERLQLDSRIANFVPGFGRSLPALSHSGTTDERNGAATTILRFAMLSPWRHRLINLDPNPGNYLILDETPGPRGEARVGFIDFGCTAELPEKLRAADRDLWMAMIHRDGEALRYAAYQQGLIPSMTSFNSSTYRTWENLLGSPDIDPQKGFGGVMQTFDNTRPLVAAMAIMVHSFRNSVDHWLGHVLAADVYLRAPGGLQLVPGRVALLLQDGRRRDAGGSGARRRRRAGHGWRALRSSWGGRACAG